MTTRFPDAQAQWNQRYAADDYLFGREPNDYLRRQAPRLPRAGSALCVADGEGRNSVWLARQGLSVQAFDIADRAVDKARRLAAEAGVTVDHQVADGETWPWADRSHDVVAAIFIQFADPPMRQRLFDRMQRAVRPGGLLILQGYTPEQLAHGTGGPGEVSHLYTLDLVREAFPLLETVELVAYEAELDEGSRHRGRSALLGYVGRRP